METLNVFKEYNEKNLENFPEIVYSTLYKNLFNRFHFEFQIQGETALFSPLFTLLRGAPPKELENLIAQNEPFFTSLKKFILNSLFVYSALIEENSYVISNPQSILIARMIHKQDHRFEIKFYTHYNDELLDSYNDKIYLGRDFINLKKFDRRYLGLKKYFLSLVEQNQKMQERARHKLRYFEDYEKPYLNEISYLTKDIFSDSMDRMKLIPEATLSGISKIKSVETLEDIVYMQNLLLELRDFTREFDNKLRIREEVNFAKYLTKFFKDLNDGIHYLRKLSILLHLKVSNYQI